MLLYTCPEGQVQKLMYAAADGRKENSIMKKYCTRCGKPFIAVGREVICPACKAQAAEAAKRAAVLRAKRASWTGESVPVRISGRASTVIRRYGALHGLPFAAALDALLQASDYFVSTGKAWESVDPYRSHRRGKQDTPQDEQDTQDAPQDKLQASKPQEPQDAPHDVKQAAKAKTKAKAKA